MDEKKKMTYTKSRLVKELSWKTQLPQGKVKELLAGLAEIACREARGTFVLPGLCKFEVTRRKARKIRNPRTGEILVLPEHDALRIVAARAAKLAVAPKVTAVPIAEAEKSEEAGKVEVTGKVQEAGKVEEVEKAEAVVPPPAAREKPEDPVSFRCPQCRQEIEAPGEMAGEEAECPTCGRIVVVPYVSEEGTIHGTSVAGSAAAASAGVEQRVVSAEEAANMYPAAFKSRTIRINAADLGLDQPKADEGQMVSFRCPKCRQEIEASQDMVGEAAQCPSCGMMLVVPRTSEAGTLHSSGPSVDASQLQAMKSRTMRINMPDDF